MYTGTSFIVIFGVIAIQGNIFAMEENIWQGYGSICEDGVGKPRT